VGSRLRSRAHRHDEFYQRAKDERYPARSIYKLEELDKRFHILKKSQRVLDLGCRPGSWLLYAAERVGPKGVVIGLDRQDVDIELPKQAQVLVGDVMTITPEELRGNLPCFQTVLSDMAPDTMGVAFTDEVRSAELCMRALDLSVALGCPGGTFVGKIFMGSGFDEAVAKAKKGYKRTKVVKPEATRKESKEIYIVATERRGG